MLEVMTAYVRTKDGKKSMRLCQKIEKKGDVIILTDLWNKEVEFRKSFLKSITLDFGEKKKELETKVE